MSTNFKSTSISITADFVCPTVLDYEESVQTIIFTTSDKFEEWFKKDAFSILSNDQGSSSNQLEVMRPKKTRITMKSSIKIGCTVKITKHVMTDGTIHVEYHWEHPDHYP
ncbi:hypothetical protein BCV72DRAFT_303811 [Rhizopus microsporus var. microsporus]|uniref:Uncharacterized protein n=1 Tax=Rhizopus microsporus var. microsporus TaxID=86635 RepID=A0A1X0R8K7_RHIZD|nr:hypothetical protein BCV72DRAFT_303811 [Rhizopus microsporus var. microsporus]